MSCLFCDIADKRTAAHLVYDDGVVVAFLDKSPLFFGHTLVIPQRHIVTLDEVEPAMLIPFFTAVQRVMRAVVLATGAQGTFVASNNRVSQSVEHLHMHVVPRTKGDGLKGFFWPRKKYENDEAMAEMAANLRAVM